MRDLLGDYLDHLRLRQLSSKSVEVYSKALSRFAGFLKERGRERVQDVTRADLEAYRLGLAQGRLATATRHLYLRSVRQLFSWLEARQILFFNPAAGLVIGRPARQLRPVPSEEEMRRLLAQPDVNTSYGLRDRALLETAYSTGARRQELCDLEVSDLDLEQGLVRVVGKGRKERMLPLGQEGLRWLKGYLEDARPRLLKGRSNESALWITTRGRPMSHEPLAQMLLRRARAAHLSTPISPHAIRRACASHMLGRGAHPLELQLLLGHSSLKTLSHYLQLSIGELKATHARSAPGQ